MANQYEDSGNGPQPKQIKQATLAFDSKSLLGYNKNSIAD